MRFENALMILDKSLMYEHTHELIQSVRVLIYYKRTELFLLFFFSTQIDFEIKTTESISLCNFSSVFIFIQQTKTDKKQIFLAFNNTGR